MKNLGEIYMHHHKEILDKIVDDIFLNLDLREKIDLAHKLLNVIKVDSKVLASNPDEMNSDIFQDMNDNFNEASIIVQGWTTEASSTRILDDDDLPF
ncbi:hypothetical protein KXJ74_15615 [Acinetobacter johnsonii]|nr:hypothetical protein KXJ74_15615 [Acinetobacter johnsonii]